MSVRSQEFVKAGEISYQQSMVRRTSGKGRFWACSEKRSGR